MSRLRVMVIAGTRPEAIKLAPLIRKLRELDDTFEVIVCSTGQHREMLEQVFDLFKIKPDIELQIMKPSQELPDLTARAMVEIDKSIRSVCPDWVLVQGDTTTAMVGALAAFYRRVCVGHVEAGLRTYDNSSPFPEEANRRIADLVADLHFAPTAESKANLMGEGVRSESICVTGNTGIDALLFVAKQEYSDVNKSLEEIPLWGERIIVVSAHRRESFGKGIRNICNAVHSLALSNPKIQFVCTVHPNPNVRKVFTDREWSSNVSLIDPLGYSEMIHLMKKCYFLLSDSGGIQEEAPSLGKPVLVMRSKSERSEGIEAGAARLVGTTKERIVRETTTLLNDEAAYRRMAQVINPYGDGYASKRIAEALMRTSANGI